MRLPWPLPAVLTWALAWLLKLALHPLLGGVGAVLAACAMGVLASLIASQWWRKLLIAFGFPLSLALAGQAVLPTWGWLAVAALLLAIYPLNAWRDAPLFPTPVGALDGLPARAALPAGAGVLDAGCGLGAGLRALRRAYPQAHLQGIEWSWPLAVLCRLRCPWAQVWRADLWQERWHGQALVYLFQRPESMERAWAKACAEMAPGSWLVSLAFAVPGVEAEAVLPPGRGGYPVWVYRLPDAVTAAVHA